MGAWNEDGMTKSQQRGQRCLTHGRIGLFDLVFRENARHRENILLS
jgi:hypothetical protein